LKACTNDYKRPDPSMPTMSYGGRRRFNRRGYRRREGFEREMHKVTCSDCGKETEVPFRPDGSKPVYCSDCFAKRRGRFSGRERPARREDTGSKVIDLIEEIRADVKAIKEKIGA